MTPAKGDDAVQKVAQGERYNALVQQLDSEHDRIVDEIITLVEIPAPPFKEAERAKAEEWRARCALMRAKLGTFGA